jgi:hypothetical protein
VFFAQPAPPLTPIIVRIIDKPTKEISVADILMGSVGITAIFLIGAVLLGIALGGLFILYRRWQDSRDLGNPADEAFQLTQPPKSSS